MSLFDIVDDFLDGFKSEFSISFVNSNYRRYDFMKRYLTKCGAFEKAIAFQSITNCFKNIGRMTKVIFE